MPNPIKEIYINFTDYKQYQTSFDAKELKELIKQGVIDEDDLEDEDYLTDKLMEHMRDKGDYQMNRAFGEDAAVDVELEVE